MRYCGNCGAPLSAGELADGVCAQCGARVLPTGDVAGPFGTFGSGRFGDAPTNATSPRAVSQADDRPPLWTVPRPSLAVPSPPASRLPLIAGGVIVVLLLVVVSLLVAVLRHDATTSMVGRGNQTFPSNPAQATPTNPTVKHPTPTPAIHATVTAVAATPLPASTPTVMPSPTPVPASTISVSATSLNVSNAACLSPSGAKTSFQLSNSGGGQMIWLAMANRIDYKVQPNSGTLSAGDPAVPVNISNIHASGSVTISAPGATNSGIAVQITCIGLT